MKERAIKLSSKDLGNGKYEICGEVFYANSHTEAVHEYLKKNKPCELELSK